MKKIIWTTIKYLINDISEINIDYNKNNKINDNIISYEDNKNIFKNKSLDGAQSKDNNNFKSCEILQIKSINIIKQIFKFLGDKNYVYKLFNYSKSFQKKLNIELDDYKKLYAEQSEFYKLKNCVYFDSPLYEQVISGDKIYFLQSNENKELLKNKLSSNINCSSLYCCFINKNCIDDIKSLDIDFNKIKAMTLNEDFRENEYKKEN